MASRDTDILMITYNRADYTRIALPRLLETCDEHTRVWIWHNGSDGPTLDVVKQYATHPRVHEFHHSPENRMLREPTNWFWGRAKGQYLSKVDDDSLAPDDWIQTLRRAHEDYPKFGIIGCWIFRPEDYCPELAERKIQSFPGGHRLLRNLWLSGSGYLMKRQCLDELGLLSEGDNFTNYCIRAESKGWVNGWYYPFLHMENMDDPRSKYTLMKSEADFQANPPLSSRRFGISTLDAWRRQCRQFAIEVQESSLKVGHYIGWGGKLRRLKKRLSGQGLVARFQA